MDPQLLPYYEAIERASADMLHAARAGNWDEVVKLEGACVLLISRLKHAAQEPRAAELPGRNHDVVRGAVRDVVRHVVRDVEPAASAFEPVAAGEPADAAVAQGAALAADVCVEPAPRRLAQLEAEAAAAREKARIMQRILVNDAEIRQLAEPWLQTLDEALQGRRRTLH